MRRGAITGLFCAVTLAGCLGDPLHAPPAIAGSGVGSGVGSLARYMGSSSGGVDDIGNLGSTASHAPWIDEDGNVAGSMNDLPARWTPLGGLVSLGALQRSPLPSTAVVQ